MPSLVIRNDKAIDAMRSQYVKLYAPTTSWGHAVSMAKMLPELRGLWVYSSTDESGRVYDYSEQGRTLSRGTAYPTYGNHGLTPHADFIRGSSQYLTRADEPGLSITGSLTVATWVCFDIHSSGLSTGLVSKWFGLDYEYVLYKDANDDFIFSVSSDGTLITSVSDSAGDTADKYTTGKWFFIAGIYESSTIMRLFVNGVWYTNSTSIPASIHDSDEAFNVGRHSRSNYLDGRMSLTFLCATDLETYMVEAYYAHTKALFTGCCSSSSSSSTTSSSTSSSTTSSSTSSTSSSTTSSSSHAP